MSCRHPRACSCLALAPQEAIAGAAAVFEARSFAASREGNFVRYEFEVMRVWKGQIGARVTVRTAASAAMCGRTFDTGVPYVVYAGLGLGGDLSDTLCSRSRKTSHASEDLELLGVAQPAERSVPPADEPSMHEPPRIEPPPVAASTARGRGCAVGGPIPPAGIVALTLFRRRRSRKGPRT